MFNGFGSKGKRTGQILDLKFLKMVWRSYKIYNTKIMKDIANRKYYCNSKGLLEDRSSKVNEKVFEF